MIRTIVAAAAALLLAGGAQAASLEGRVINEGGTAVAGVSVSFSWGWRDGRPTAEAPGARTDDDGAFSLELDAIPGEMALIAYDETGEHAGLAVTTGDPVTITLKPSVHVTAQVTSTDLGGDVGSVSVYWMHGNAWPVNCSVEDGRLDVRLPAAEFNSFVFGQSTKPPETPPSIDGTQLRVDLGTIDLPGSFIAMNAGLPAPEWTVSDARGMNAAAAQIKDLEGRWVLVEFWGFW